MYKGKCDLAGGFWESCMHSEQPGVFVCIKNGMKGSLQEGDFAEGVLLDDVRTVCGHTMSGLEGMIVTDRMTARFGDLTDTVDVEG